MSGDGAVTPYYSEPGITIYHGRAEEILPSIAAVDVVLTDPPYGETSLDWDIAISNWPALLPSNSLWCFGSMRFFLAHTEAFYGWKFAQDLVWEKHNGSNFHADRFRRVHEHLVQFYRGEWAQLYKAPQVTHDATAKTARRKQRPAHLNGIRSGSYVSVDGGPRLARSVVRARSCHGFADHPTQKPVGLCSLVLAYSCPPGGSVLDPFMGSGSSLLAARSLGLTATGIESEERYCEAAVKRLAQGVLPLSLDERHSHFESLNEPTDAAPGRNS